MNSDHHMWRIWVEQLHRWGLEEVVAWLLEALGPLTLVGAQFVYLGQPMLNMILPQGHLAAAARLLENTAETEAFVAYLRRAD